MKTLIITLALLAVFALAQTAVAGGGFHQAFLEQWKAVQAKQQQIDAALNRIDRDASSWGVAAGAAGQKLLRHTVSPKKKVLPEQ